MHAKKLHITSLAYGLLAISLFILPLFNAWMLYPLGIEHSITPYAALGGSLPWSDAHGYYNSANTILEFGTLDGWSTRRPLNAILFSMRLWLSNHNFQLALIIQALICGFSCYLAAKCVERTFGKMASMATFIILFVYAAIFIPTTLTEILGLTLGSLAFVFLWKGIQTKQPSTLFFFAGLILMVGMNVRAGALFVIPLLCIWLGYHFKNESPTLAKKFNWHIPIFFTTGLLTAIAFNWAIVNIYHAPTTGAIHGNFSYTLFGLVAGGKTWAHAFAVYPELATKSEAEAAHFLYLKSYEIFIANPTLLLLGILKNLAGIFKSTINFFQSDPPQFPSLKVFVQLCGCMALFFGYRQFKKLYKVNNNEIGLIRVVLIGMLLSVAMIWRDGGFRVFAVTIPFVATAIGVILSSYNSFSTFQLQSVVAKFTVAHWETKAAYIMSILVLCFGLFGPLCIQATAPVHIIPSLNCHTGTTPILTRKIAGTPRVNLQKDFTSFKKAILGSNAEDKESFLKILDPSILKTPSALAAVYDANTKQSKYVVAPLELFSEKHAWTGFCAVPITSAPNLWQFHSYGVMHER